MNYSPFLLVSTSTTAALSRRKLHIVFSCILGTLFIPGLLFAGFPLRFAWSDFFVTYWVSLTLQSIFLASSLALLGSSSRRLLRSIWFRYWSKKPLLGIVAFTFAESVWVNGWSLSFFFLIVTLGVVEVVAQAREATGRLREISLAVLLPAIYLFLGFIVVFGYNDIVASFRYYAAYDQRLNQIDSFLLGGVTVSALSHRALNALGPDFFAFLEFVYFGMFPQIGAGVLILGIGGQRDEGFRLAGTILTAYYLALICYALWPSLGPFVMCPDHFDRFPADLRVYATQKQLLLNLKSLWEEKLRVQVGTDYYIALPCMHIAQPVIVMWFLRRERRILAVLTVYNIVLLAAIVLLEWHYVVDILGGLVIAALALLIADPQNCRHKRAAVPGYVDAESTLAQDSD